MYESGEVVQFMSGARVPGARFFTWLRLNEPRSRIGYVFDLCRTGTNGKTRLATKFRLILQECHEHVGHVVVDVHIAVGRLHIAAVLGEFDLLLPDVFVHGASYALAALVSGMARTSTICSSTPDSRMMPMPITFAPSASMLATPVILPLAAGTAI